VCARVCVRVRVCVVRACVLACVRVCVCVHRCSIEEMLVHGMRSGMHLHPIVEPDTAMITMRMRDGNVCVLVLYAIAVLQYDVVKTCTIFDVPEGNQCARV
jgi:hypothetical protein